MSRFSPLSSLFSLPPFPAADGEGFEPDSVTTSVASTSVNSPKPGGAKCSAFGAISADNDAGLQSVVEAWPTLFEAVRADILAKVRAAGTRREE